MEKRIQVRTILLKLEGFPWKTNAWVDLKSGLQEKTKEKTRLNEVDPEN